MNLSQANVGFIHMSGVRNMSHFAAEKTLSFLTKRQVKLWFLVDRDERCQDEIDKIKQRLGERAIAHIWSKRELENYLIHPRLLRKLIERKKGTATRSGESLPLESELVVVIDECAEGLKQLAIDKRIVTLLCTPLYPDRDALFKNDEENTVSQRVGEELDRMIAALNTAKAQLDGVRHTQAEEVDRHWQQNKLSIVPGDELLDAILRRYGCRFRKNRDGATLASLMAEAEIDHEIKDIMNQICT